MNLASRVADFLLRQGARNDDCCDYVMEEKSHVRYPTRYPTIRNAEETAEYQYTRGVPLAPQIGFPVISGNPFFIPKSEIQTSIPIPPVTGENRTQPDTSQSKNLHRVEESSHQQASQHPKTSSHWRKLDATKHLTVQIPPVTGTNDPLRCLPESVLFQRMEESPR